MPLAACSKLCSSDFACEIALMQDTDDVALHFQDDEIKRKSKKHPYAVSFHLLFRVSAQLVYLFCGWFSDSFITSFVLITLLLSMDFWTVKNISGRLLVGLRWWNYVDDDGVSHWVFESRKGSDAELIDATESTIFWSSLVACPILWVVFFFISIFKLNFKWFMIVFIGIILNGANLYGYIRCKVGGTENWSTVASSFLGQSVMKNVIRFKTSYCYYFKIY
ncbi:Golgi apparatus membrane protein TVP23 B [Nymphon striatum]|nr:Golgi apparatus membrane protein TVP23 B [Nymphon striatum]